MGIVWAECDSRRRARHTYRMLSSHALIARILFKKRVECGMRDPFLSGQDALRLTLHAKPQVTKYATWDFLSEYPFESM